MSKTPAGRRVPLVNIMFIINSNHKKTSKKKCAKSKTFAHFKL